MSKLNKKIIFEVLCITALLILSIYLWFGLGATKCGYTALLQEGIWITAIVIYAFLILWIKRIFIRYKLSLKLHKLCALMLIIIALFSHWNGREYAEHSRSWSEYFDFGCDGGFFK